MNGHDSDTPCFTADTVNPDGHTIDDPDTRGDVTRGLKPDSFPIRVGSGSSPPRWFRSVPRSARTVELERPERFGVNLQDRVWRVDAQAECRRDANNEQEHDEGGHGMGEPIT